MKHKSNTSKKKSHSSSETKKTHSKAKKCSGTNSWKIATIVLAILLVISLFTGGFGLYSCDDEVETSSGDVTVTPASDSSFATYEETPEGMARLEFYVMSQCPYGTQVEDAIIPVLRKMGDVVDFHLDYIVTDNGDGTFKSLHGQPETDGNIAQLCAMKHSPEQFLDFLECQNADAGNVNTNWKGCAESTSSDADAIATCFEGDEGKDLLRASLKRAQDRNAQGSPTIFIADQPYKGGRDAISFQRAICALVEHAECESIPECGSDADCTAEPTMIGVCENPGNADSKCAYTPDIEVTMTIVNDKECDTCDTSRVLQVTKQLFPNLKINEVDYSEAEAKSLLAKTGVSLLPLYVFDGGVSDAARFDQVGEVFAEADDMYYILPDAVGANYDPTIEAVPNNLKLFVMSQCPYGSLAVKAMDEVLAAIGDNIDFELYFIANDAGDGTFSSLHGQPEVDENIRQVCAMEHYPDTYFDYVLCQAEDIGAVEANWEGCAADNGLDVETIRTCADGDEGTALFRENIKEANSRGIGGSPTFVVNNKKTLGGAQPAEAIKQSVCSSNPGLAGCDETLTEASAAPQGGGCGA